MNSLSVTRPSTPTLANSSELQKFLQGPDNEQPAIMEGYNPYGIWALGMRLMGWLRFPAKATIISSAFLLVIAYLGYTVWADYREKVAFARTEQQGVDVLKAFVPFNQELVLARNLTRATLGGFDVGSAYNDARAAADQRFPAIQKVLEQQQDALSLKEPVAALGRLWAETANSKNGLDASGQNTVFAPITKASIELAAHIADQSGIVLDPDVDTLYLGLNQIQVIPDLLENLGQVRAWSTYLAAKADTLSPEEVGKIRLRYVLWDAVLRDKIQTYKKYLQNVTTANASIKSRLDAGLADQLEEYRALAYKSVVEGNKVSAADLWSKGGVVFDHIGSTYLAQLDLLNELLQKRITGLNAEHGLILAVTLVALALAAYLFWSFYLVTQGGNLLVRRHLQEMSHGDLRNKPGVPWSKDESSQLLDDLRVTYNSLHELIRKVRHGARALHSAASEITAASTDLSGRTESAAASLEEQAAAMEEIGETVTHTAKRADAAANFARENARVAENGGKVFADVVSTMRDIESSSSKIGDIIGVIDGIAFQTNILALNAAVEAARAGDAGRGFAVVASEVRTLAQRSADAAREIKTLISVSLEKVESGMTVVTNAGTTMNQMVSNAGKITSSFDEISRASSEQSTGVSEVARSIADLDRHTQQNAARVEETNAAAGTLTSQADILQNEIANFIVA